MKIQLPQAHFGKVGNKPVNWRKSKDTVDVDDEELAKTPDDVLKMLGFDPKEIKQLKRRK
jgi:hypothetical protein